MKHTLPIVHLYNKALWSAIFYRMIIRARWKLAKIFRRRFQEEVDNEDNVDNEE